MVSRLAGGLELIGVRAVILDVRNYVSEGKRIEAANEAIRKSIERLNNANARVTLAKTNLEAIKKGIAPQEKITAAVDAEEKARKAATRAAQGQIAALSKLTQASGNVLASQRQLLQAQDALKTGLRTGVTSAEEAKLIKDVDNARKAATASLVTHSAALNRFTLASDRSQEAQRKLATAQALVAQLRSGPTTEQLAKAEKELAAAEAEAAAAAKAEEAAQNKLGAAQQGRLATATKLAAGVAAVGIVAGAGVAIKSATDFQTALAKIDVLTDATTEETDKLGKSLLDLANIVPSSPNDLGAAAYFVLSSGIKDVGEALNVTTIAAKDSAVGLGTVQDVTRVLVGVLNAYGHSNITASKASDILIAAVKEGTAEASEFADSIGRVLPNAASMNVTFDELAASIAAMTNQALTADEATTALRQILQEIQNPGQEAIDALAGVGLTAGQLRAEIRDKGLIAAMEDLFKRFGNNASALTSVIPNVRALTGFLAAFGTQSEKTDAILSRVRQSLGITENAFQQMSQTVGFQAGLLKNQFNIALISIGAAALPAVNKALYQLVRGIRDNQAEIQKLVGGALKTLVSLVISAAKGVILLGQAFSTLARGTIGLPAAFAAMGAALLWAMPGTPLMKGLALVAFLLGKISEATGPSGSIAQEIAQQGHKTVGVDVPGLGRLESGGLINKLFLGSSQGLTESQFQAARATKEQKTETDFLTDAMKQIEEAFKGANLELPGLNANIADAGNQAKAAADKLKELAQDFQKSSEAAGQVESLTAKLGLFGNITKELADAAGLSAKAAGAVQGFDAVARAEERAANKAFNLTEAMAAVATAFQRSAQVAQEIVLGMARSALEASRAAASAIFANPTREVANLGVNLARAQLGAAQTKSSTNPQLNTLKQQLASIDKQIAAQKDTTSQVKAANNAAQKASQSQLNQLRLANQIASSAARDQLDQMKLANDTAAAAAQLQQIQFERLIAATQQQASDLQAQFLKNNEDLQRQINQAIGRGDTATALSLTDKQRAAAKAYQQQAKALQDNEQALTKQQKQAQLDEQQRQIIASLELERAQVALDAAERVRQAQEQMAEAASQAASAQEDNTQAVDSNTKALENQRQRIQDQIDKIEAENEARGQSVQSIQDQIDVYQAQSDLLKAQITAADNTLLTQEEQRRKANELIEQIGIESQAVRDLSDATGKDLIPEMEAAREAFSALKDLLPVLTNESIRNQFIEAGLDPATEWLKLMTAAGKDFTKTLDDSKKSVQTSVEQMNALAAAEAANINLIANADNASNGIGSIIKPPKVGEAGLADSSRAVDDLIEQLRTALMPQIQAVSEMLGQVSVSGQQLTESLQADIEIIQSLADQFSSLNGLFTETADSLSILNQAAQSGGQELQAELQTAGSAFVEAANTASQALAGTTQGMAAAIANGAAAIAQASTEGAAGIAVAGATEAEAITSSGNAVASGMEQTGIRIQDAGGNLVSSINNVTQNIFSAARAILQNISNAGSQIVSGISNAAKAAASAISGAASAAASALKSAATAAAPKKSAVGGIYSSPTLTWVGETHEREAIIPLERPARARQILGTISPAVLASILPQGSSGAVFAPNIVVTGETLDSMESMAIRAVQRAFRDARVTSIRGGGLISQGLGPSR